MPLTTTTQPTAGDQLDALMAELDPLNAEMDGLMFTKTRRIRTRFTPEQEARMDEIAVQQRRLTKAISALVRDY